MDELKKQIEDLENELSLTINARERAHADGDGYHENIYKSEQAQLVQQIQDAKNKLQELETKNNIEKWHKDLTPEQIEELKAEGLEPGDEEYDRYLWDHGIDPTKKDKDTTRTAGKATKWHPSLTPEQIEELKSEGIEPGDEEYDRYLWDHGIKPTENDKTIDKKDNKKDDKKPEMPSLEEELKKDGKEEPEEPIIEGDSEDIKKLKDEYDKLNDLYLDALEELEEKRQKMENGEISYEEYQKFSLYVIDRYKYMKELYERITNGNVKGKDDKKADDKVSEEKESEEKKPEEKTPDEKTPEEKTPEEKTPDRAIPEDANISKGKLQIYYNGKTNSYTYTQMINGKPQQFEQKAYPQYFSFFFKKSNIKADLGKEAFDQLFTGPTSKAYKKCDPHILHVIYRSLGVNAARDYLLEVSLGAKGKKEKLPYDITYDLSGINGNKKLGFFDRLNIGRNASNHATIAKIIPKLSKKQLKANENKLLAAAANQYDQGEFKPSNERTEFIAGLQDYEPAPVQKKPEAKNAPEPKTIVDDKDIGDE